MAIAGRRRGAPRFRSGLLLALRCALAGAAREPAAGPRPARSTRSLISRAGLSDKRVGRDRAHPGNSGLLLVFQTFDRFSGGRRQSVSGISLSRVRWNPYAVGSEPENLSGLPPAESPGESRIFLLVVDIAAFSPRLRGGSIKPTRLGGVMQSIRREQLT